MNLRDFFLHAVTLTAEFALLLLGIKHLLPHWLHWKYSSDLPGFGISGTCSKRRAGYYLTTKCQKYSYEHKLCYLDKWGCCFVSYVLQCWERILGWASFSLLSPELLAFEERPSVWSLAVLPVAGKEVQLCWLPPPQSTNSPAQVRKLCLWAVFPQMDYRINCPPVHKLFWPGQLTFICPRAALDCGGGSESLWWQPSHAGLTLAQSLQCGADDGVLLTVNFFCPLLWFKAFS